MDKPAVRIREILKRCEETWPTDLGRHNFTYNPETDALELAIFANGQWHMFVPEGDDLIDLDRDIDTMTRFVPSTAGGAA